MKDLIQIVNDVPRVSHRVIADNTNNQIIAVDKLVNKYLSDLEEFGSVVLDITKVQTKGGMQKQKTFYLNEAQATLLMTYLRNSEIVRNFKKALVKEFFALRDDKKLKELTARVGGLTYANNQFKRQIKDLKATQKEQLKLPHKSFDDNMDFIINQTMQELNRDTKKWDFLQNRANYFTKYVAALKDSGTEQQKYMISEIDRYKSDSIKAQKEVEIVKNKLENLQKVVDDYTNMSNMMLRTRYAS